MSTKWIDEAISSAEDMWGSSTTEIGTNAKRELAAIRRAAAVIAKARVHLSADEPDELAEACDLMAEIAKETE